MITKIEIKFIKHVCGFNRPLNFIDNWGYEAVRNVRRWKYTRINFTWFKFSILIARLYETQSNKSFSFFHFGDTNQSNIIKDTTGSGKIRQIGGNNENGTTVRS